ncbi:MAG: hypothetical protein ACYSWO_03920 [Planctomycetota bacterium]
MKSLIPVLTIGLMVAGVAHATGGVTPPKKDPGDTIKINNSLESSQIQKTYVVSGNSSATAEGGDAVSIAGGGSADSDSFSASSARINTTSNYETRTPPITTFPPSLPYWNHGGWGTIKAYFPNGPNKDDNVYERTFDPQNAEDKRQLRGVLESLPHDGPVELLGGILNGVGALFCGPDNYHHGRGFEIANSLVRERRRKGAPLLVFIDTNVDTSLLRKAGYTYVGKVSAEGNVNRNWDQVYNAAVAETLPWDVDILLISGGMKGVTVGSNLSFPGAGGAYSQANYSVSMFGSVSSGITEGKGKAVVSAEAYRFSPGIVDRTTIPKSFYDRIRASARPRRQPQPVYEDAEPPQRISAGIPPRGVGRAQAVPRAPRALRRQSRRPAASMPTTPTVPTRKRNVGAMEFSKTLWEMAEFDKDEMIDYVILR